MRNDPRVIYPGTSFYAGLTAPFGGSAGMGFNTSPGFTMPRYSSPGLSPAPQNAGARTPPLSNIFGQAMDPYTMGTTMR